MFKNIVRLYSLSTVGIFSGIVISMVGLVFRGNDYSGIIVGFGCGVLFATLFLVLPFESK